MATLSFAIKGLRAASLLLALCVCGCRVASVDAGEGARNSRARLFSAAGQDGVLPRRLAGSRLVVLFTPDFERCTPETMRILRALRQIAADYPDTRVFTLRPASRAGITAEYGEALPGARLTIPDASYQAQRGMAPTPRIEVWSRDGRLLLMRSLPRVVTEKDVYDEVLWARSFTAPS